jgi:hypothetical protein
MTKRKQLLRLNGGMIRTEKLNGGSERVRNGDGGTGSIENQRWRNGESE